MPSLTYRLTITKNSQDAPQLAVGFFTLCQVSVAAERYLEHHHVDFSRVHDDHTG